MGACHPLLTDSDGPLLLLSLWPGAQHVMCSLWGWGGLGVEVGCGVSGVQGTRVMWIGLMARGCCDPCQPGEATQNLCACGASGAAGLCGFPCKPGCARGGSSGRVAWRTRLAASLKMAVLCWLQEAAVLCKPCKRVRAAGPPRGCVLQGHKMSMTWSPGLGELPEELADQGLDGEKSQAVFRGWPAGRRLHQGGEGERCGMEGECEGDGGKGMQQK